MEHTTATHFPGQLGGALGRQYRYSMARTAAADERCFLCIFEGVPLAVRAREWYEIKAKA